MALELNRLTAKVNAMGAALAMRGVKQRDLVARARADLDRHAQVGPELRHRINRACAQDASWRGAEPVGDRLDVRSLPAAGPLSATLIAADGSQIYPDRHGIAPYYLLNVGSIVLRQGSGEAPEVSSRPELFYQEGDLYDEAGRLVDAEYVNGQRQRLEFECLASLAEDERQREGGDISRPLVALLDGPLLQWTPQRAAEREIGREVRYFTRQLARLRHARAVPIGYVDRPASANVLRTLELASLDADEITRERLRSGEFRGIADRSLFADLPPNGRSGLFGSTSRLNERYADGGHKILFFYLNISRQAGAGRAQIARVELPEWVAADGELLDLAQHAVYADCQLTGYPYVLARAHELAVVSSPERAEFEKMLGQAMLRNGLAPAISTKAGLKRLTAHRGSQAG